MNELPMATLFRDIKRKNKGSPLEASFFAECKLFGLPIPQRQFKFHPTKGWLLDFAWPDRKIAVEINGGLYMKLRGGHSRGANQEEDYDKLNTAQLLGWKVFVFGPNACYVPTQKSQSSKALAFMYPILCPAIPQAR